MGVSSFSLINCSICAESLSIISTYSPNFNTPIFTTKYLRIAYKISMEIDRLFEKQNRRKNLCNSIRHSNKLLFLIFGPFRLTNKNIIISEIEKCTQNYFCYDSVTDMFFLKYVKVIYYANEFFIWVRDTFQFSLGKLLHFLVSFVHFHLNFEFLM